MSRTVPPVPRLTPSVPPPEVPVSVAPRSGTRATTATPNEFSGDSQAEIAHAMRPSKDDVDTAVLTLSPEFLCQLRSIAPRRRRSPIPYVLALSLVTFAAAVGGNRQLREFIAERWLGHSFGAGAASNRAGD